jgi:hypothetical protein
MIHVAILPLICSRRINIFQVGNVYLLIHVIYNKYKCTVAPTNKIQNDKKIKY